MRVVLQRVNRARVDVEGETVGRVEKGYVAFLGVAATDDKGVTERMVDKIYRLRVFADESGKTNKAIKDVGGGILVVSQFTLMADLTSNRPSFSRGAKPELAKELFEYFISLCKGRFATTESGRFASHMHVYAENDGPFTLVLDMNKQSDTSKQEEAINEI